MRNPLLAELPWERLVACRRFDSYVGTVNEEMFEVYDGEKMEKFRQHDKHSKAPHFTSAVPALGALTADGLKIESFEK